METTLAASMAKVSQLMQNGSTSTLTHSEKATPAILGCNPEKDGIEIALLIGESPLNDKDSETKRELLARLTASYKLDYFAETSVHCQAAKDLFRRACNKGWTASEFLARLDEMTEECKFPTWTPADFFAKERSKLHSYSWVLEQMHKDKSAMLRMEAYRVPGLEKPLWRYAERNGKQLEGLERTFFCGTTLIQLEQEKTLLAPKEKEKTPLSEEDGIAFFVLKAAKAEKLVAELQQKLEKKMDECSRLREDLFDAWAETQKYKEQLQEV